LATTQFPHRRVLLPRTRLAYIHLRNLLSDAKRDRSARVAGYVAIWLPEEMLVLYLIDGEPVNASQSDARGSRALPVARALERVPAEPEYGEVCFHAAAADQLACMFVANTAPALRFPASFSATQPETLFPYLMSTAFDGFLEVESGDVVSYIVVRDGAVTATFHGPSEDVAAEDLLSARGNNNEVVVNRWASTEPLPVQAPALLVDAYRELATGAVQYLIDHGSASAPRVAEHARDSLLATHPVLDVLQLPGRTARDCTADTPTLTAGVAAWLTDLLWAAMDHDAAPEQLLRAVTWERRHIFQSAGLYERLPWKPS
jgi:hypothetical protein